MVTLYRKYRSRNFQELVGQEHVVSIIKQAVQEGRLAHAYLFTGPRGTGKTSLARILAKAINCTAPVNGEPCNECSNCIAISEGKYMDLIEIDAASNRGIDEIRSLKETISFMPVQGKHKVYIIDEVHMLTEPAFNALLKTLEEPPEQVLFVLATTEPHKIPLTIISRTQRFDFKLASEANLSEKLNRIIKAEGFVMEDDALALVIKAGQGSYRDSETILEKVLASASKNSKDKKITKEETEAILGYVNSSLVNEFLDTLMAGKRSDALLLLNNVYEKGLNLVQFLRETLEAARIRMVNAIKANSRDLRSLLGIIKELNQASLEIKTSLVSVLPIEVAIINITAQAEGSQPVTAPTGANLAPRSLTRNTTAATVVTAKAPLKKAVDKPVVTQTTELSQKASPAKTEISDSVAEELPVIEERPKSAVPASEAVEKLMGNWPAILEEAKKYNHFLTAILTNSRFEASPEGEVLLKVSSAFHKKQLDSAETRKILNKITASFCGESVHFTCIIDSGLKAQNAKSSNAKLVEDLLL